jgi:hypothetical protein
MIIKKKTCREKQLKKIKEKNLSKATWIKIKKI